MVHSRRGLRCLAALAAFTVASSRAVADGPAYGTDRFLHPSDDARPLVRWWWFGPAIDEPEVKREIAAMKAGGFGGFELQDTYPLATGPANLRFLSPEHLRLIGVAAREAHAAGLRMDLTLGSGWPYGGATIPIEQAAGRLRIETGAAGAKPRLHEGEALIDTVTSGGRATSFIAGRTGMKVKRPALGAEGYVVDHLDVGAMHHFLDTVATPMLDACGTDVPHALFCDSLESYGEDWTPTLLDEFRKRRGYDLRPLLPALAGDGVPDAAEIRHDWGRTLTELFDDHFVRPMADFAHGRGSRFRVQAYGTPSAGESSYLGADLPEGEGYQWHSYRATRYASSAAHLMGVPVSSSEAFTWIHAPVFRATPLDVKAEANQHFLQGVNQLVCHGWPSSPPGAGEPGWSFYVGGVFNDHNPWWTVMPDLTRYLTRCSDLLRQGLPANDVAVYLAEDDAWARFTPGHVSLSDGVGQRLGPDVVGTILDAGYNLDFFDDRLLSARGRVDGGALAFGDLRYRIVVLAGVERIPPATMAVLEQFVRGGGTLVATRSIPSRAPGYKATADDQKAVTDAAARLFGGDRPAALFVHDEHDLPAALGRHVAPDVTFDPPDPALGFVHRHTDFGEIYFLANTSNRRVAVKARFRNASASAQLWNLSTAEARSLVMSDGACPLKLEPYDATAVVFAQSAVAGGGAGTETERVQTVDVSGGWSIRFPGDAAEAPLQKLGSWTDDPAKRTFSGTADYTRGLTIDAAMLDGGRRVAIDFGQATPLLPQRRDRGGPGFVAELAPPVGEVAVVFVNGKRAGSAWCPPYRVDMTPWLRAGDNELRVQVANTAVNGLSGGRFPNYDVAGVTAAFGRRFDPAKGDLFQPVPSGLLGPVTLVVSGPVGRPHGT